MKIKKRYYYTPIRMPKIWNTDTTKWKDLEQHELSLIAERNAKWYSTLEHFGRIIKLNPLLPYDPAITLFGIYPMIQTYVHKQKPAHGYL